MSLERAKLCSDMWLNDSNVTWGTVGLAFQELINEIEQLRKEMDIIKGRGV
jgi:hypothetical protein